MIPKFRTVYEYEHFIFTGVQYINTVPGTYELSTGDAKRIYEILVQMKCVPHAELHAYLLKNRVTGGITQLKGESLGSKAHGQWEPQYEKLGMCEPYEILREKVDEVKVIRKEKTVTTLKLLLHRQLLR